MFLQRITSLLRRLFARSAPESFLREVKGDAVYTLGEKPTVLGRSSGQQRHRFDYIVIDSETVGRQHAVIEYCDGVWRVIDQSSLNGTFVNGRRVQTQEVKHGDRIRLHKVEFEFLLFAPSGSDATVAQPTGNMDDIPGIDGALDDFSGTPDLDLGQQGGLDWDLSADETVSPESAKASQPHDEATLAAASGKEEGTKFFDLDAETIHVAEAARQAVGQKSAAAPGKEEGTKFFDLDAETIHVAEVARQAARQKSPDSASNDDTEETEFLTEDDATRDARSRE